MAVDGNKMNRLLISLTLILSVGVLSAKNLILEISELGGEQIAMAGFKLNSKKPVQIKALGAGADRMVQRIKNFQQDEHQLFVYAWILDAKTREMVWRMTIDNTEKVRWTKWNRQFDGEVELEKGQYELYFSAVEPDHFSFEEGFLSFDKIIKKIFRDEDWWQDQSSTWNITLDGVDEVYNAAEIIRMQDEFKQSSVVDLTLIGDDENVSQGFSLSKPAIFEVYALGEGFKGKMYDWGWIINADTREKVWAMTDEEAQSGGGAVKNRVIRETIQLDDGNYLVYFKSDDSHSARRWNANPPYDPRFWGISLRLTDGKQDLSVATEYKEKAQEPIVSIIRVGDYAYKEESIEVKKRSKIRIYALGEGRSGDMFDYGWISDVGTGRIIWRMRYGDTKHAGGSSKNRLYDDVIILEPGRYTVHYQTDDSHSYEGWNARKPQNAHMWGITLYPVNGESDIEAMKQSRMDEEKIIAELTGIRDHEHVRKQFYIDKPTRIRIKCLGEGDREEMYDYGWIEDINTRKTVWKMTYRSTEYGGGARKNRLVNTVITLQPGTYLVHYRTDDSHSFNNWNARPPYDPQSWGITLYQID